MFLDEHKLDKFRSFCYPVPCFSTLIEFWSAGCVTGIRRSLPTSFQAPRFSLLAAHLIYFACYLFGLGHGTVVFFAWFVGQVNMDQVTFFKTSS